jgi:amidase
MADLHTLDATALAALIRARAVSSREVVLAHLARIDEVNGAVNAVTVPLRAAALAAADAADRCPASGPLHGVPFTVKENLDCLGSATTHGVPALRDALPYLDAPAVARLKAAGAIPIARTNLSELGLRLCSDSPLRGRTRNPWDPRRTAGGSSGGDAVAVATGMTPIGLGNDLGGSLRIPAHCAGVATLKPTTGRIPHAASLEPLDHGAAGQLMLAPGPLARSVRDLRACLAILAGRDRRDPRSVDAPLVGPDPDERRVALVTALPGAPLPDDARAAIHRAGGLLAAAGWEVEEAAPPELERVNEIFARLIATDFSVQRPQLRPFASEALDAYLARICAIHDPDAVSNLWIHAERSRLARAWSGFLAEYAVVIGPTWATPVWPIDADLDPRTGIARVLATVRFITPGNALGLPALTLPMGPDRAGLPTSVQIYADLWREDLCLAVAAILEAGAPPITPITPIAPR